jgi:diacylglycerol kinase
MFVVAEENMKTNRFRQSNIFKKMEFVLDGVHASLDDYSVRLAFYVSIPLSIIFFIFNPNIITKIVGLLVFSFWIIFETINTSIESVIDRIGPEIHPLSKIAKDTAAVPPAIMGVMYVICIILFTFNIIMKYNLWSKMARSARQTVSLMNYVAFSFMN